MKILVMKFGGTSVASLDRIRNVASIINKEYKRFKLVVVLSAMAGVTNDLQKLIDEVDYHNSPETDMVITSGEQVSVVLLSMILKASSGGTLNRLCESEPLGTPNCNPRLSPKEFGN